MEFISPMRKGRVSAAAKGTDEATAFGPFVADVSSKRKLVGLVFPLQTFPGYSCWLTMERLALSCARNEGRLGILPVPAQAGPISLTPPGRRGSMAARQVAKSERYSALVYGEVR